MKRVLIATCVALACAVNLAAQTPAGQDKPQPTAGQAASADKGVTLRGCLRAGDAPDTFVLANAAPASGATGTAGAAAATAATKSVRLIGSPAGTNLKEHVGHTIEVTGMMAPQGATPSTPSATAGGAAGAAKSAASEMESLNLKNIKHVDAKCGA
jgi:hypothetical protein